MNKKIKGFFSGRNGPDALAKTQLLIGVICMREVPVAITISHSGSSIASSEAGLSPSLGSNSKI